MKVYGTTLCPNCRNFLAIQKSRGIEAKFINFTESTALLGEFLRIRDTAPMYEDVKKAGRIGIPLYVNENGDMTLDINLAMSWIDQPAVREDEFVEKV